MRKNPDLRTSLPIIARYFICDLSATPTLRAKDLPPMLTTASTTGLCGPVFGVPREDADAQKGGGGRTRGDVCLRQPAVGRGRPLLLGYL